MLRFGADGNHIIGGGNGVGTTTIAAGTGAGTSSTVALVRATDLSGYITVTTGTLPTGSATVATVTFGTVYTVAPKCFAWPSSATTQALVGIAQAQILRAGITTNSFTLTAGSTALTATTALEWGYTCTQ